MQLVFTAEETFALTWAGLVLSDETLWTEQGKTEHLEAFRTADDDVTLRWESSDPSVAEVDDEGYVKGKHISEKPVIIKAAFDYLGQTYTAECKTWVRKPVKSAKQTERETALKVGESKALTLKISPANATVKNAYWFSEDEAVATVDENGMVTAFSPGIVKIVAITWDGHYKATCTVTVEGESANG